MKVALTEVKEKDKSVLRNLLELYNYDFSEYDKQDVNEHGLYGYTYFDHYWTLDSRQAFFIRIEGKMAGFVMVNEHCYVAKEPGTKSIGEFFVMKKYRRMGVGKRAAKMIFAKFPGKWEVIQHRDNKPSQLFWQNVINQYTKGNFKKVKAKTEHWEGQALLFDNSDKLGKNQL